jgi:hypothetical protein
MDAAATFREAMPADFPQIAGKFTNRELMRRYGKGYNTIARWRRTCGIPGGGVGTPPLPRPADLAETAPSRSTRELGAMYGVSTETIRKWLAQIGVKARGRPQAAKPAPKPHLARPPGKFILPGVQTGPIPPRDGSLEGMAASYLQPYAPTYRCDDLGRQSPSGKFWRVGNAVLTPGEMMERAERKGFERRMLAA